MGSATPWVMEGFAEGLKVAPEAPAGLADRVMLYSIRTKLATADAGVPVTVMVVDADPASEILTVPGVEVVQFTN